MSKEISLSSPATLAPGVEYALALEEISRIVNAC